MEDRGERYSSFLRRTFRNFTLVFGGLAVVSLAIAYRDPEIVGMNLAEREETMSKAAVIDKRGLKRRLDAGDLSEVDVAFYLPLRGRFEIELFETVAAEHHNPGLFRVSGIDEHAFGHSGVTPERVPAAARKSAGGAIPCAGKPAAPGVVLSGKDWAMTDLISRARIGFGFLYSASPGAAALRGGKRAADHSHRAHSAAPGAAPGRRTAFFRGTQFTEESSPLQRLPRALGCDGERASHAPSGVVVLGSYGEARMSDDNASWARILGAHTGNAWIDRDVDA